MAKATVTLQWEWMCPNCYVHRTCPFSEAADGKEWEHKCSSCGAVYIARPFVKHIIQREDDDGAIECVEEPDTSLLHNHKTACKAYARRLREYADTIEQLSDALAARDRGTLTGAIYRASRDAKAFADRHRNNLNIKKGD